MLSFKKCSLLVPSRKFERRVAFVHALYTCVPFLPGPGSPRTAPAAFLPLFLFLPREGWRGSAPWFCQVGLKSPFLTDFGQKLIWKQLASLNLKVNGEFFVFVFFINRTIGRKIETGSWGCPLVFLLISSWEMLSYNISFRWWAHFGKETRAGVPETAVSSADHEQIKSALVRCSAQTRCTVNVLLNECDRV